MWVDGATGAMQHATCNDLKKSGVCILIKQLCRHHAVVLIGPSWFVIGVQNEQNVCMGQASLLPLNDMNVSHHLAKNALLQKLIQQVLQFANKNACDQIRAIIGNLAGLQSVDNLFPLGVAGHGDEQIRLAILADNGHGILVQLIHVSVATNE